MRPSTILAALSALSLSVLAAPMPTDISLVHEGIATWFDVGLGACGDWDSDSDLMVAISSDIYGQGYPGPHCNQYIEITAYGVTEYAIVRDECPSCDESHLDMSPSLFEKFRPLSDGVLSNISWKFMEKGWSPY